jgi:hypothetical protein
MTEDVLFVCKSAVNDLQEERVSENEETRGTVVELLLREPEIVAWLEDYRPCPDEAPDEKPPRAA